MDQMVKNLPAMQEIWVLSLCWEGPLEEGMAAHPSILAWRIPMGQRSLDTTKHSTYNLKLNILSTEVSPYNGRR